MHAGTELNLFDNRYSWSRQTNSFHLYYTYQTTIKYCGVPLTNTISEQSIFYTVENIIYIVLSPSLKCKVGFTVLLGDYHKVLYVGHSNVFTAFFPLPYSCLVEYGIVCFGIWFPFDWDCTYIISIHKIKEYLI